MFITILTFLGLNYRVALLKILYFVVPGINIYKKNPKNQIIRSHKIFIKK